VFAALPEQYIFNAELLLVDIVSIVSIVSTVSIWNASMNADDADGADDDLPLICAL